ncbi:hypothetical protein [Roseibacillus ishigakijimensis]|uniref:Uncharacterized protein n=1 Tax=Roseibacillus ishigakijimensis TaxID=454146 RepID=A0A934RLE9_9BACT|nr:hypothetical protein [Roseibacillus ishigakijimensis]MBK1833887.1 hypothetical protein [Roseibacillus ishigakijimensis]
MIKNVFYALTILLAGAAAFFGFSTKGKLETAKNETIELFSQNNTLSDNIDEKGEEIEVAKDEKKVAVDARNETSASLENEASKENGLKSSLGKLEAEIEGYDADLAKIRGAINEAEVLIREMVPGAGSNLNVDAVVGYIEDLENQRKQLEEELDEKTRLAAQAGEAVNQASSRKENLQERLGKVKERIANNGVSASVSAVSNEYGFVIVNRGANNSNIEETSQLLVSRGNTLVARLKVHAIEPTQTICNIVQDSLKPGQRVRTGDRVTLETPASN